MANIDTDPVGRDPFLLVFQLAETGRPRQTAIKRTDHEGYRSPSQEECERARQHGCQREDAQNNIELARKDAAPQLPPGVPFKGQRKRITESGQRLSIVKLLLNIHRKLQAQMRSSIGIWHHLDGAKRSLCAAYIVLNGRSNHQSDIMEFGERRRMRIGDKRNADIRRITIRR